MTVVTMWAAAAAGERFAPGAFDSSVGTVVPVTMPAAGPGPGERVAWALITAAVVADDPLLGNGVRVTYEVLSPDNPRFPGPGGPGGDVTGENPGPVTPAVTPGSHEDHTRVTPPDHTGSHPSMSFVLPGSWADEYPPGDALAMEVARALRARREREGHDDGTT